MAATFSLFFILAGALAPASRAADDEKKPGAPAQPEPQADVPPEYRGFGIPNESTDAGRWLRRARERWQAEDWGEGFQLIDEVLALATGTARPDASGRGLRQTAKKDEEAKRQSEKVLARGGIRLAAPLRLVQFGGAAQALRPAAARGAAVADSSEDDLGGAELLSLDGIRLLPIAAAVRELLVGLPQPAQDFYVRSYAAPAQSALEKGLEEPLPRKLVALRAVAERYPLTAAGAEAWHLLGAWLLDGGQPFEAATAWEARLELPGRLPPAERAALLAQAARAYALAGATAKARELLALVIEDHPETTLLVRGAPVLGKDVASHELFQSLLGGAPAPPAASIPPRPDDGAADDWATEGGRADHAALARPRASLPPLGSLARWLRPLAESDPASAQQGQRRIFLSGNAETVGQFTVAGTPLAHAGNVYLRTMEGLLAVDARTGKLRWRAASVGGVTERSLALGPGGDGQGSAQLLSLHRDASGGALVIALCGGLSARATTEGKMAWAPNALAAFEALNGKLRWIADGALTEVEEAGGLTYVAPPIPAGRVLVAPAFRGQRLVAVGLSEGGRLLWVEPLYSMAGAFETYGVTSISNIVTAASQGVVVLSQGHGLVYGIEGASGRVLWASRYRSGLRQGRTPLFASSLASPPRVRGRTVVVAPPDSDHITAFDLFSGQRRWETKSPGGGAATLLGIDDARVVLGGRQVRALSLETGQTLWTTPPFDQRKTDDPVLSGFLLADAALVTTADDRVALVSLEDGSILETRRFVDRRRKGEGFYRPLLAGESLLLTGASHLFAVEGAAESTERLGDDGSDALRDRASLLRGGGHFDAALEALFQARGRVRTAAGIDQVHDELRQLALQAADQAADARPIERLLEASKTYKGLLRSTEERVSFEARRAGILLEAGRLPEAVEAFAPLVAREGLTIDVQDGWKADASAWATDSLLEAARRGATLPAAVTAAPREAPGTEASAAVRARWVLRRPLLAGTSRLLCSLADDEGATGRWGSALELLDLARASAGAGQQAAIDAQALELRRRLPREPRTPGLDELLPEAGAPPLAQRFWQPPEEGVLFIGAPRSSPLSHLLVLRGGKLRFLDTTGQVVSERELPGYPDLEDFKLELRANIEEPLFSDARASRLVLSTPAGLYAFRGGREGGSGDTSDVGDISPRDLRLAWRRPEDHPLLELKRTGSNNNWGWSGGRGLPGNRNFFPETLFLEDSSTCVLKPSGELDIVRRADGRLVSWQKGFGSAPVGPPHADGASLWVTSAGGGLLEYPDVLGLPKTPPGPRRPPPSRPEPRPSPVAGQQIVGRMAGGLGLLARNQENAGGRCVGLEASTGRILWQAGSSSWVVSTTGSELWWTSPGKLEARSPRSGRLLRTVPLPGSSVVGALFEEPPTPEGALTGWLALASQGGGLPGTLANWGASHQTGNDLWAVRLDAAGEKLWERQLHAGPTTCAGLRLISESGRSLVAFNGAAPDGKWLTRLVAVEPADGELRDVLSVEIRSQGNTLPPRVLLLRDGIAVGNGDGFGLFSSPQP